MSYNDTVLSQCKELQVQLNQAWETHSQDFDYSPEPLLELVTAYNSPMKPIVSPGRGKTVTVEVVHSQRRLESDVVETDTRSCVATTPPTEATYTYELDPNDILSTNTLIAADTLQRWCGSNPELFQREIMKMMSALRRKVADRIAGEIAVMPGNWASDVTVDGDNALVLNTLNADGTIEQLTAEELDFAVMQQTGYGAPYAVIGDRLMYQYFRTIQAGCCANSGLNLDELFALYGFSAMYDRRLATELSGTGANSLVIRQGAIQVLNYVEAGWKDGTIVGDVFAGANYTSQAVVDPVTGLLFELRISDNCGQVSMVMDTVVKAVALPNNLYKVGDTLFGANYINKVKVTNP